MMYSDVTVRGCACPLTKREEPSLWSEYMVPETVSTAVELPIVIITGTGVREVVVSDWAGGSFDVA
jgi:hypothetical protein